MTSFKTFGNAIAPEDTSDTDGVLLVDKPMGPTSHDVVNRIRRTFNLAKVGHGGTLDPMATGLMILLLGKATKLSDRFLGGDKVYEGTMHLGISTDSQDAMGDITRESEVSGVNAKQIEELMKARVGDGMQVPPMTSALKIKGVPLYKHARKGHDIERKARLIHIFRFRLLAFDPPTADFEVKCSKGTYVRTLAHDIGEELGCGAHLSKLRRTECGELKLADATALNDLLAWSRATLSSHLIPMRHFR